MKKFFDILGDRLCVPSTWSGIGPAATGIVWNIWPDHWGLISSIMIFCGFMAVLMGQAQR